MSMEILFAATFIIMNLAAIPRIIQAWEKLDSVHWAVGGMIAVCAIDLVVLILLLISYITIQLPA